MDLGGLHAHTPLHFLQLFVVGIAIGGAVVVLHSVIVGPAQAALGIPTTAAA